MKTNAMFFMAVVCMLFLLGCGKPKDLAQLEGGAKLRQDCARMLTQLPPGEIAQGLWPTSIRQLKPLRVTREPNNIRIVVNQEPGKYTVGYDVFADPSLSPATQGVWVQRTKEKGVYIFKLPY